MEESEKGQVTLAKKPKEIWKDVGQCVFKISEGNNDRTANELEYVDAIQESTSRGRTNRVG